MNATKIHASYVARLAAFCGYNGVDLLKYGLDEPFTFDDASEDNFIDSKYLWNI